MKAFFERISLGKQILISIVIGLFIGFVSPVGTNFISPLGDIFLRLLQILIVPLVFLSITIGVCKMGDVQQLRTVGVRFILWIVISAIIAAAIGVVIGLVVQPGQGTTEFLTTEGEGDSVEYSFIDNVVSWVPSNIIDAMLNTNMLQIIFFCLLLGVALLSLGEKASAII